MVCNSQYNKREKMTVNDVKSFFKTWYQVNKQTGIALGTTRKWRIQGFVDIKQQIRIEKFTKGKLKASLDHVPRIKYDEEA